MSGRLAGKVCLVTGSSGGLGNAFCRAMAREGAVVAAAGRNLARLEPLLEELPPVSTADWFGSDADGRAVAPAHMDAPTHMAVELDTGDPESVAAGVRVVEETLGRVDVLVNNAAAYGDLTRAPFWELPLDEWDRVMASNVRGPLLVSRAVSAGMRARKCGRIINIASATFWSGSANWAHYVASKGALIGLTRVMAKELGSDDICVNVVAPGFTLTEASLSLIPGAETYGVDRGCVKRAQQPEDVVGLVVFLASDESGFITGQSIIVDGGRQFN